MLPLGQYLPHDTRIAFVSRFLAATRAAAGAPLARGAPRPVVLAARRAVHAPHQLSARRPPPIDRTRALTQPRPRDNLKPLSRVWRAPPRTATAHDAIIFLSAISLSTPTPCDHSFDGATTADIGHPVC